MAKIKRNLPKTTISNITHKTKQINEVWSPDFDVDFEFFLPGNVLRRPGGYSWSCDCEIMYCSVTIFFNSFCCLVINDNMKMKWKNLPTKRIYIFYSSHNQPRFGSKLDKKKWNFFVDKTRQREKKKLFVDNLIWFIINFHLSQMFFTQPPYVTNGVLIWSCRQFLYSFANIYSKWDKMKKKRFSSFLFTKSIRFSFHLFASVSATNKARFNHLFIIVWSLQKKHI